MLTEARGLSIGVASIVLRASRARLGRRLVVAVEGDRVHRSASHHGARRDADRDRPLDRVGALVQGVDEPAAHVDAHGTRPNGRRRSATAHGRSCCNGFTRRCGLRSSGGAARSRDRGASRSLELEVRVRIHTDECERVDDKLAGITVRSVPRRVGGRAVAGARLANREGRLAGGGFRFEGAGEHDLRGARPLAAVPGLRRIAHVRPAALRVGDERCAMTSGLDRDHARGIASGAVSR
jgi:hypothetical protein